MIRKATDTFAETVLDDETVLMHTGSGKFFNLTGTAHVVWSLIDGTTGTDALCQQLISRFEIAPDQCRADLERFLSQMKSAGFILCDTP